MTFGLLAALWASKPLRWAVALLAGFGAYQGWKHHQRGVGAAEVVVKIEQKANENVEAANVARDTAGAGAGRVRNPYVRRDAGTP